MTMLLLNLGCAPPRVEPPIKCAVVGVVENAGVEPVEVYAGFLRRGEHLKHAIPVVDGAFEGLGGCGELAYAERRDGKLRTWSTSIEITGDRMLFELPSRRAGNLWLKSYDGEVHVVVPGSPAEGALNVGDRLLEVDGEPPGSATGLEGDLATVRWVSSATGTTMEASFARQYVPDWRTIPPGETRRVWGDVALCPVDPEAWLDLERTSRLALVADPYDRRALKAMSSLAGCVPPAGCEPPEY